MATTRARRPADGPTRYTAYLRIRKGKAVIHTEEKRRCVASNGTTMTLFIKPGWCATQNTPDGVTI